MNWQAFLDSSLAIWIPIIILVAIIIVAFRKQIGGLIDRLTSGNVEAGKEGVKVKIEAPAPGSPASPPASPSPSGTAGVTPASPPTTPDPAHHYGAVITNAESTAGGALAEDQTGQGALIDHVKVKDDLIASSTLPPSTDPKA